MDRRDFLKAAAGAAAALPVLPALAKAQLPVRTTTVQARGYVSGRFAMTLDGVHAGFLHETEGGDATADVVTEKVGPDHIAKKHIAGVKYEDITITCGTGMSKAFYQWIADTLNGKAGRKNGAIISADYDLNIVSTRNFFNALITEVGFPALDAASKDAAKMTIKISPEYTRVAKGSGKVQGEFNTKVQKQWLPANFKLSIAGLEEPCSKVNKIEALVIKRRPLVSTIGELRDYTKEPGALEVPNLAITLPETHAAKLSDWHEDFVIKGNCADAQEKSGSLQFLSPNLAEVLFELSFQHMGIFRFGPEKAQAGADAIARVRAEMYCEQILLAKSLGA